MQGRSWFVKHCVYGTAPRSSQSLTLFHWNSLQHLNFWQFRTKNYVLHLLLWNVCACQHYWPSIFLLGKFWFWKICDDKRTLGHSCRKELLFWCGINVGKNGCYVVECQCPQPTGMAHHNLPCLLACGHQMPVPSLLLCAKRRRWI